METFLQLISQLSPLLAILILVLVTASVYMWRRLGEKDIAIDSLRREMLIIIKEKDAEIERLRNERNQAVEAKDKDFKETSVKVMEIHEKTLETLSDLSNNVKENTKVTHDSSILMSNTNALVSNFNAVLISMK